MAGKLRRSKKIKVVKTLLIILVVATVLGGLVVFLQNAHLPVLMPQGIVAEKERQLIILATSLGLVVVVPVFVMLFFVAWKYRVGNQKKAKYSPNWDSNKLIEGIWWGIPLVIISILGVVAWQSSHELDPYKPLDSNEKPVKIQVVALQWKWLFLYPDYGVASMNAVAFPANTPINFEITADAPMNAFWIPSLGSQVYAMTGMSTKLHLQANEGVYDGRSANISGEGFADMHFKATAMSKPNFDDWVNRSKQNPNTLTPEMYAKLAEPSSEKTPSYYVLKQTDLYDTIVMKYMGNH